MNIVPIPVRMLMRQINATYGEKMNLSGNSPTIQAQNLSAFIYDSFINKYGLLNVAERKLKEIFLSTIIHRSSILKIELFARFIGFSAIRYTADDMHFMFNIVLKLSQRY